MEPANHFTVLRRYWRLLVGCTLAALVIGFLLTPAGDAVDDGKWQCKVAITPVAGAGESVRADQVLSYAQGSDVTTTAAKKLHVTDVAALAARRTVAAASTQMLVFTTTGPTQQSCTDLAAALSDATITGYSQESKKSADESIKRLQAQADTQQEQVNNLQHAFTKAGSADQPKLQPQLTAALNALTKTLTDISTLQNYSQTDAIQQWGSIDAKEAGGSLLSSPSRGMRLTLAVALGLALGIVAAVMLSRMDTRLRTRNATEEAFNLPVIGEIPQLARRLRRLREPLVVARPSDPAAEAYRSLRSTLLLTGPESLSGRPGAEPAGPGRGPAPVILVMSGRSGDGRTTTVANLAAALAETGRTVLVLDCDFRHPQTHLHFGIGDGPGMAELLSGERLSGLDDLIRETGTEGVRLITGGNTTAYPAALVLRAGEVLRRAREHADVVLIDTSPLLHANDAYDLVQHADAVLVTAMAGNVTPEQADRVSELLARTGVPVAGVALLGTIGPSGRRLKRDGLRTGALLVGRTSAAPARSEEGRRSPAAVREESPARPEPAERTAPPAPVAEEHHRAAPSWARRPSAESVVETTLQLREIEER
ncbi:AAA family ATPase [Kitasatospora sp. DSM 101779]|uniref:nucleotide-binding protein n=1 Tax=Kitasatospora sp. DSM 101779 TaxID=2853165 RepID=UPI0021D94850|nr:AAA family ATPase [Kitasatospora sp. DSM 101779]MCU7825751.1 AAA family ATPase [Kitasatospora sp. DSM 101779]